MAVGGLNHRPFIVALSLPINSSNELFYSDLIVLARVRARVHNTCTQADERTDDDDAELLVIDRLCFVEQRAPCVVGHRVWSVARCLLLTK